MEKWVCDVCGYIYDPEIGDPDNGIAAGFCRFTGRLGLSLVRCWQRPVQ
jgi:hypothetical protein